MHDYEKMMFNDINANPNVIQENSIMEIKNIISFDLADCIIKLNT